MRMIIAYLDRLISFDSWSFKTGVKVGKTL